jgi:methionyl-tRNA formyltransferase
MKRIVIFGNQEISINCTSWLQKQRNVQVIAFVGCEKPLDKKFGYPSTRIFCKQKNIEYFDPPKLDDAFYTIYKRWKPDLCLSIYFRNIFPKKYISVPSLGFVNIHPSLLPKYRGSMPTLWALLNEEKTMGITMHYINQGIDTGDIISQKIYKVSPHTTGYQLHTALMVVGFQLFKETFPRILSKTAPRRKQHHTEATYYSMYHEKLREIDWYNSSNRILSRIYALTKPYAGAITHTDDKNIIVWKAKISNLSKKNLRGPGKIVKVFGDGSFIVSTIDGFLRITDYSILDGAHRILPKRIRIGSMLD